MSTRGVFQLRKLQLFYAHHAGTSKGVRYDRASQCARHARGQWRSTTDRSIGFDACADREFVGAGMLNWARANPQVSIEAIHRANRDAHVVGHYRT